MYDVLKVFEKVNGPLTKTGGKISAQMPETSFQNCLYLMRREDWTLTQLCVTLGLNVLIGNKQTIFASAADFLMIITNSIGINI